MDLELTEDQVALRDTVRRSLDGDLRPARAVHEGGALDRDRWRGLIELGTTSLLVAEDQGGLGLGMVEAALAAEELGGVADPTPWIAAAVHAVSLGEEEVAAAVGAGDTIAVVVDGGVEPDATPTGGTLSGSVRGVLGAMVADVLIAVAEPHAWLVPATERGVTIAPRRGSDPTRYLGDIDLDGAAARALALEPDAAERAILRRDAALVADGLGAGEAAMTMTVEYARVREQFGQPIGAFQAVQHLCADMLVDLELTRAGLLRAAWAVDQADPEVARHDVAVAVAQAAEALPRVTERAIQVHGGIGVTWEHDLHLLHARVLSMQQLLGGARAAVDRLAAVVVPRQ
ncbi:MAG: acyl-CoA/acyl-ACP dehydrogenase [Actinobacteria bacterium]|nr:acyl-CoA/acyl-ACP dehydrogenase [Actinomycetota bacterium]